MNEMLSKYVKLLMVACLAGALVLILPELVISKEKTQVFATPVRQSKLDHMTAGPPQKLTLRDAARNDRWFGLEVRNVCWSPDGKSVFFRWNMNPSTDQNPSTDPWFRVDYSGKAVEKIPDSRVHLIPAAAVTWNREGNRAVWVRNNSLYLYDASKSESVYPVLSIEKRLRNAQILSDGHSVLFMIDEDLFQYEIETGILRQLTRKHIKSERKKSKTLQWLEQQQIDLFERLRDAKKRRKATEAHRRQTDIYVAQAIPVDKGVVLEDIQLSPDKHYVTFKWRKPNRNRPPTKYMDYVTVSGYAEEKEARAKVGEKQDEFRMGIIRFDPTKDPDEVRIVWVDYSDIDSNPATIYGPYWSLEGNRAVVQIVSLGHKDRWICRLDLETGKASAIVHDHDDAWLGGPPPLMGYLRPALLEWLPGEHFVFASERTGWCHLYLVELDGTVKPLTKGTWEVRIAQLSRDRSKWLIAASREHPSDDHLYIMPATGGELVRLTEKPGRHRGYFSPDGQRIAVVYSETIQLPDLFLCDAKPDAPKVRITVSGADNYFRHKWTRPEVVSFNHPDGGLVWAALFRPEKPTPENAAILHIHGGGYRQFSHRGWSVYGYDSHIGLINFLVKQGYSVLDLDYRGSAGFGSDYRSGLYRSMGIQDVNSAVAAVDYLVKKHGVDRKRIGIYGISYGGFLTLMSLFRYPGV
ncbi:MAG: DPP IV N-terminal domain-containing protein, partial [Candidatus Aminicenantaceae bacterium]